MKFKVENLVKLYRTCTSSIPISVGASLLRTNENLLSLQSYWSIHNLEQADRSTFVINYSLNINSAKDEVDVSQIGFPIELGSETLSAVSQNGIFRATIRRFNDKKGEKKQILEVWSTKSKLKTFDLSSLDVHGDVCEDALFSSMSWSADCKKILYVAERKKPKTESFFSQKKKPETTGDEASKETTPPKTEKGLGVFNEEWGESLNGRHNPAPFVFNLEDENVEAIPEISDDYSCGQAIWGPNDDSVIFIAWPNHPRRLGLRSCHMRPNKIYRYDYETKELVTLYDDPKWCSFTPRLSPDGKRMVFLDNIVGGAHNHCSRLLKYDFESNKTTLLVDIVNSPKKTDFPGLYVDSLPIRCWTDDNLHVIFASSWKSKEELLCVNVETGSVERLTNDENYPVWSLFDINESYLVASRSSPSLAPHLVVASYRAEGSKLKIGPWQPIEPLVSKILPDIEWSIHSVQPQDTKDESMEYEYILLKPLDVVEKVPLIVLPHGGPHVASAPRFLYTTHMLLKLGFAVILVNYRGSTGFGETPLQSLLGKAGFQDVVDVQTAVERALKEHPSLDANKVCVYGGSHGGFLAAHLIGQYPDFYKACVAVNPVTDLRGKLETTDIPDWGWAEAGLAEVALNSEYKSYAIAPPDACKVFWDCSPVQYIPKVKTPVLMLLGKVDLRVPYMQGLNYYYALKAIGKVDARLFIYDDNHSIGKIENYSDELIRIALFLAEKLGLTDENMTQQ